MKKRKTYDDQFKARVAREAVKGEKTISEIATQFDVHPNQIMKWKRQLLENVGGVFSRKRGPEVEEMKELIDKLNKKIGEQDKDHQIYPYLLREVEIDRPNKGWAADITYIRLKRGFVYLVAVMDVFSRYIISWRLANTLEPGFCCEALKEALESGCPEYFNTDQGAQFTSSEFLSILQRKEIKISLDGKGRVIDNIFIERFWRTLKYEEVYTKCYETVAECSASIGEFIRKYNEERLHQSLGLYDTPFEAYYQLPVGAAC